MTAAEPSLPRVVGLQPWLPWPLSRWRWWTEPVRAERLAALRIGISLCLLLDILVSYLPLAGDLFGRDSMGSPEAFHWMADQGRWSLLRGVTDPAVIRLAVLLWGLSTLALLLGFGTRISAVVTWALSVSLAHLNYYADNAGDTLRTIILLHLMLCPCGAVWSLDARFRRASSGSVYVHPWVLRLLFVQLAVIYLVNGLHKLGGDTWREGSSLYYVMADLTLARWSYAMVPTPGWLLQLLTWTVLAWELLFVPAMLVPWRPLAERLRRCRWRAVRWAWVLLQWNREVFLGFGVAFHLGIALTLELGFFPFYVLCLYLPLVPWERSPVARG